MLKPITIAVFIFLLIFINAKQALSQEKQKRNNSPLIVNHLCYKNFDSIPINFINDAAKIPMMFRHASIGFTIDNALNCLQGTRTSPSICNLYPDYRYDRRNWIFEPRGNSGWYGKIRDFVAQVAIQIDTYDVFSFKYCYLDGLDQVAEPCGGSNFNPAFVKKAWDSLRINMDMLETKYPDKTYVWWTIPLTQPGQRCTDTLNYLIRQYAVTNNKILFDIADIESYDTFGRHLVNSSGWEMAFGYFCGEAPPGPSCHPNWTGSILIAKAFWWMMASIAGMQDSIPDQDSVPVLTTKPVISITPTTAESGGEITSDGGQPVTERGIVWGLSPSPTISLSAKTSDGSGTGIFTSQLTGLLSDTVYYVRAYATNSVGTGYGNELNFKTLGTGIYNADKDGIKIYSFGKKIKLKFSTALTGDEKLLLTDLWGRKILSVAVNSDELWLDMSAFNEGCYTLTLFSGNDLLWNKLILINQ